MDDADQPEPEGIPADLAERIDAVRERAEQLAARVAEFSEETRAAASEPEVAPSGPRRLAAWLFERRPARVVHTDEPDEAVAITEPERRPRPAPIALAFEALAATEGVPGASSTPPPVDGSTARQGPQTFVDQEATTPDPVPEPEATEAAEPEAAEPEAAEVAEPEAAEVAEPEAAEVAEPEAAEVAEPEAAEVAEPEAAEAAEPEAAEAAEPEAAEVAEPEAAEVAEPEAAEAAEPEAAEVAEPAAAEVAEPEAAEAAEVAEPEAADAAEVAEPEAADAAEAAEPEAADAAEPEAAEAAEPEAAEAAEPAAAEAAGAADADGLVARPRPFAGAPVVYEKPAVAAASGRDPIVDFFTRKDDDDEKKRWGRKKKTDGAPDKPEKPADKSAEKPSEKPGKRKPWPKAARTAFRTLIVVAIAVVAALLLRTFVVEPYYVPSESMEPTLHGCTGCNDDHVLVEKLSYLFHDPQPGDIVVFNRPSTWKVPDNVLIKRVIGVPGDDIRLQNGKVYRNGARLDEPYVNQKCHGGTRPPNGSPKRKVYGPVPNGDVFVMGDNRCDSEDSRYFGVVPQSKIIGRAFLIIWPFHRIHSLS